MSTQDWQFVITWLHEDQSLSTRPLPGAPDHSARMSPACDMFVNFDTNGANFSNGIRAKQLLGSTPTLQGWPQGHSDHKLDHLHGIWKKITTQFYSCFGRGKQSIFQATFWQYWCNLDSSSLERGSPHRNLRGGGAKQNRKSYQVTKKLENR